MGDDAWPADDYIGPSDSKPNEGNENTVNVDKNIDDTKLELNKVEATPEKEKSPK